MNKETLNLNQDVSNTWAALFRHLSSTFQTVSYTHLDVYKRQVLNRYYQKYRLPLLITENGLGAADILTENGKVHDGYRIDYLRRHIQACRLALDDGVELMGYSPWSFMDLLSSHEGFRRRYGFLYVDVYKRQPLNYVPRQEAKP